MRWIVREEEEERGQAAKSVANDISSPGNSNSVISGSGIKKITVKFETCPNLIKLLWNCCNIQDEEQHRPESLLTVSK